VFLCVISLPHAPPGRQVLIRDTNSSLKQLGQFDGGSAQEARKRKMEQEKLAQDFQAVLRTFQSCQKIAIAKEKETVRVQRARSFGRGEGVYDQYDEDASLIDDNRRREQQQLDAQIDTQAAFIEEREEGIKELESQMCGPRLPTRRLLFLLFVFDAHVPPAIHRHRMDIAPVCELLIVNCPSWA